MYEIEKARQPEVPSAEQGFQRVFANREFTLHCWYDRKGGAMTRFYLLYGTTRQRCIEGTRSGAVDYQVDERGWPARPGGEPRVPARFDSDRFERDAGEIDRSVRSFVLASIRSSFTVA